MRFAFASSAVTELDFRGFNPSKLKDVAYLFSSSLVGGNGTAYASSKASYNHFRIDTASTPGYLTAA